jgi:MOSC domain-containing protein YiiM
MKIISTNLAKPVSFQWKGQQVTTGIYKKPVEEPLYLTKNDVVQDEVSDRLHHGGYYKACYLYSAEQYPYWQEQYPHLDWNWGMFGENLTVADFDEHKIYLGDIYKLGNATVQVSQYREPCYKLGHKFGAQDMIRQFIEYGRAGTYISILEEGSVSVGDEFQLVERPTELISVAELFHLVFARDKDQNLLKIAAQSMAIPHKKRVKLRSYIKL